MMKTSKIKVINVFFCITVLLMTVACKETENHEVSNNSGVVEEAELEEIKLEDSSKIISTVHISSKDKEFYDTLITYQWSLPIEDSVIRFREHRYSLGHPIWDGPFCSGSYTIKDNTVTISYPDSIDASLLLDYQKNVLEWVFEQEKEIVYTYDQDYRDFDVLTCLWNQNRDKKLVNYSFVSPFGDKYILEGIPVIKYDIRKSKLIMLDDLNMREAPSVDSAKVIERLFIGTSKSGADMEITGSIVYKNSINSFDAVTVNKDTIDEITAPWYRIQTNQIEEGIPKSVWVFGGYVREIPQLDLENANVMNKYYTDYILSLISRKIIVDD